MVGTRPQVVSCSRRPQPSRWLPPPEGKCKINADGAVAKTQNRDAVGTVYRSEDGVYQGASVVVYDDITRPGCLEALACREFLELAIDLGVGETVVATDCTEVVQGI
jgi:ribonuclease HI